MKVRRRAIVMGAIATMMLGAGCAKKDGKIEIELVQYKPEAAKYFEQVEKRFNESQDEIHLKIQSPNDATTVLRTRFIREDYPDLIGIGGDINYSYYVDAKILEDVSDYKGIKNIKGSYIDIDQALEIVPTEGTYAIPYVANAAGVLYNKEIFQENGWEIPNTWDEFIELCEKIKKTDLCPFYFGYKDTWTCLAPWNAMAIELTPKDVVKELNKGNTTFQAEYQELSKRYLKLAAYGEKDPYAYGYNDACTAFANGGSAMYMIGSYAVPQILSVNPDLKIDSFVMPACEKEEDNILNSGIDLQFCVTRSCKNKEAAYKVLDFLLEDENVQEYIKAQNAIPCKKGEFELAGVLDGMKAYIDADRMLDFQDHAYPSEMAMDAQLQTFLIQKDVDAFLKKLDRDWPRYNKSIMRKVKEYEGKKD